MSENSEKAFEWFELLTAILLGLAAIGASWASYQGGLWGGTQSEAFSEAANMTTKAANSYNDCIAEINGDFATDLQAKKAILEGMNAEGEDRANYFEVASNIYSRYLSEDAYEYLELPSGMQTPTKKKGDESAFKEAEVLPEAALIDSLESELDDSFVKDQLASATEEFAAAEKRFQEGRNANVTGDRFSLNQVFFTISLFFAGLGLVFKTGIRWGFLGAGYLVFFFAVYNLFQIPWA